MLEHYRALDLTDERCYLCGSILADLGAEVIKVERPRGAAPGKNVRDSLPWLTYNRGKKCITLDLEKEAGQAIFRRMARATDLVVESFPPGHLDDLGIGYRDLSGINPSLVMTSISPFGGTGPRKDWQATDIVGMAMGGYMYLCGDPDRPPVRISVPQAYQHASAEAVVGSLTALYSRHTTGAGQLVDVSMQQSVVRTMLNAQYWWDLHERVLTRQGSLRAGLSAGIIQRNLWQCQDGWVAFIMVGGGAGASTNQGLAQWMDSEGEGDSLLNSIDWQNLDLAKLGQETVDKMERAIAVFFSGRTKSELYEGAARRGIRIYPVATIADTAHDPQLNARGFWTKAADAAPGEDGAVSPGAFAQGSLPPCTVNKRAPSIGEHNDNVYRGELGLSESEMRKLKQDEVI